MCPLKCGNILTWDFSFLASCGLRAQSHWLFATVKSRVGGHWDRKPPLWRFSTWNWIVLTSAHTLHLVSVCPTWCQPRKNDLVLMDAYIQMFIISRCFVTLRRFARNQSSRKHFVLVCLLLLFLTTLKWKLGQAWRHTPVALHWRSRGGRI